RQQQQQQQPAVDCPRHHCVCVQGPLAAAAKEPAALAVADAAAQPAAAPAQARQLVVDGVQRLCGVLGGQPRKPPAGHQQARPHRRVPLAAQSVAHHHAGRPHARLRLVRARRHLRPSIAAGRHLLCRGPAYARRLRGRRQLHVSGLWPDWIWQDIHARHEPASSISANAASMGMVPRALHRLFEMLDLSARSPSPQPSDDKPFTTTTVLISFLELYNEEWHDLLNTYTAAPSHTASSHSSSFSRASYKPSRPSTSPSKPASVQIRQTPDGRVFVSGALEVPVSSAVEAMRCLHRGMAARCTAATSLNDTSSRSHAIFTVTLQQRTDSSTTISKLHFVDLAGSERLKRTRSSGERLAEGISINQGLLTLGRVVNTLASNAATHTTDPAAQAIVPYRESKLTRMLQNSLGGNSKTVILACISSLEMDIKESVNTLKYAAASRKIRNVYEPNVESVVNAEHERAMSAIKSRVVELETENESLRARLAASDARSNHTVGSTEPFERIAQLENTIVTLEGYVARIKEERSAEMSVSLARIHDLEEQVDSWRTQLETLGRLPLFNRDPSDCQRMLTASCRRIKTRP
ncbi:P-loop containing nucleoside triphosphate hydrolase protein, partial [Entophlyctis helioformis]